MTTRFQVTIDCADPAALGGFWAEVLGYVEESPPEGHETWEDFLRAMEVPEEDWNSAYALVDPNGKDPRIYFQRVPEAKAAKNRVHLDIRAGGPPGTSPGENKRIVRAEVGRLVELGATELESHEEFGGFHIVMRDPEGNEFCVTASPRPDRERR
jgi:hypothetical protein